VASSVGKEWIDDLDKSVSFDAGEAPRRSTPSLGAMSKAATIIGVGLVVSSFFVTRIRGAFSCEPGIPPTRMHRVILYLDRRRSIFEGNSWYGRVAGIVEGIAFNVYLHS
jgi:hypothetical protein